jgi:hypothetical protein
MLMITVIFKHYIRLNLIQLFFTTLITLQKQVVILQIIRNPHPNFVRIKYHQNRDQLFSSVMQLQITIYTRTIAPESKQLF